METIRHLENNNIISISYKVFNQLSIIEVNTIVEALGTLGKDITITKLKRFKPNEVDMTSYIHLFTLNDYSYYYRNEAIATIPIEYKIIINNKVFKGLNDKKISNLKHSFKTLSKRLSLTEDLIIERVNNDNMNIDNYFDKKYKLLYKSESKGWYYSSTTKTLFITYGDYTSF